MSIRKRGRVLILSLAVVSIFVLLTLTAESPVPTVESASGFGSFRNPFDSTIERHARDMLADGRRTFRFATFGDEAFWGDTLKLHRAITGEKLGGVGPGVSPATALAVGLKVDVDALPVQLRQDLRKGRVDLDDPATTLTLLQ